MKIFLILISLGLMVCSQSKPSKEKSPIFCSSCDTALTVGLHSSVTIQRPFSQGTGYDWQIAYQSNPALVSLQPTETEDPKNTEPMDGHLTMQLFKLRTLDQTGVDTLVLHYRRSFEKKPPEKVCKVILLVKG